MGQHTDDILEVLRKDVGCPYISDLRLCTEARWRLSRILTVLPPERFSGAQWREAYTYLTGEVYQGNSKCLRQLLTRKLRVNMDKKDS